MFDIGTVIYHIPDVWRATSFNGDPLNPLKTSMNCMGCLAKSAMPGRPLARIEAEIKYSEKEKEVSIQTCSARTCRASSSSKKSRPLESLGTLCWPPSLSLDFSQS